ncbi:hypothetical protein FGO68_gene1442 [Halteria grandinella]|uniref:Uncharacterized protein n=1 Tax=Halteria grandinella TaxID=5974 RepID=A0A8J8NWQ3_HALGN|nr:hypothetical protein FGO68_gene1442 [Halteria grandinella]
MICNRIQWFHLLFIFVLSSFWLFHFENSGQLSHLRLNSCSQIIKLCLVLHYISNNFSFIEVTQMINFAFQALQQILSFMPYRFN